MFDLDDMSLSHGRPARDLVCEPIAAGPGLSLASKGVIDPAASTELHRATVDWAHRRATVLWARVVAHRFRELLFTLRVQGTPVSGQGTPAHSAQSVQGTPGSGVLQNRFRSLQSHAALTQLSCWVDAALLAEVGLIGGSVDQWCASPVHGSGTSGVRRQSSICPPYSVPDRLA